MRTIYKESLIVDDVQIIRVPKGAKILKVGLQKGHICVWYECETDNQYEDRKIYMFGTGHEMPDKELRYIGTLILQYDLLVFHFYEEVVSC